MTPNISVLEIAAPSVGVQVAVTGKALLAAFDVKVITELEPVTDWLKVAEAGRNTRREFAK